MPFRLTGAPASFQEYINKVLHKEINSIYIVYLDNILIFSKNPAVHSQHIQSVLTKLKRAKLFLNLKKYKFHTTKVKFLGFIIKPGFIKINKEHVKAIIK